MDKPWKVVLAFVAVFIAGAIFGGLFTLRASGHRLGDWRALKKELATVPAATTPATPAAATKAGATTQSAPAPKALILPGLMQQYTKRLKLTPTQREKIRPIVGRATEDLQRLRRTAAQDLQRNLEDSTRVADRMYSDIAALLSPDQRDELETMRQQNQERVEKERKHRAELVAAADAALKAERANAARTPTPEGDAKAPVSAPPAVPAAKQSSGGK